METILDDIMTWSWFSEPHGYNFNGFLISDSSGNVCIDPVEPGDEVLRELTRRGVSRIVISNRNHVRAANQVRTSTGARVSIDPADTDYARSQGAQVDDELQAGAKVGPLTVVAVPGKSPGEVAFHWPERKLLIVGDAVISNPPGKLSLLREKVMDDPARLRNSVRDLFDLDFDTILAGDGVSVVRDAKQRLQELVETFPR
ncbi:MAG: uncharacterized protein JWM69_101 [Candidatus Binatus sp.]|nr:uncharacterized protein [Candidatus Binatus sp.]